MSVVVVGAGALAIGGALFKGGKAAGWFGDQTDYEGIATTAAGDIKTQQMDLLGDVRKQAVTGATQQASLGFDIAQSQFGATERQMGMGMQTGMRNVQEFGATAASKSGLATSGTVTQKVETQTGDLMSKYKSDMTKLFESRDLAGRERDLTISTAKEKADLSYRSGEMSAEEAYQSTLTDIEANRGPEGFLEGMFS